MGSFDVSCSLSNLGIHEGDATGFLILEKHPEYGTRDYASPGQTLIINSADLYHPFLPAVYGTYNDYGRITDIRESATTKILEEIYHRPIKTIIDCICDNREVYYSDGLIAQNYKVVDIPSIYDRTDKTVEEWLVDLGFEFNASDDGSVSYVFHGYELFRADTETTWLVRTVRDKRVLTRISGSRKIEDILNTFGHHTRKYPGFDPNDFNAIRDLHRLGGMFFLEEVFTGMNMFNNTEHYMNRREISKMEDFKDEWNEFLVAIAKADEGGSDMYSAVPSRGGVGFFLEDMAFPFEHMHLFKHYSDDSSDIFYLSSMIRIADNLNRPFSPSTYVGYGEGDRASKMLNNIVSNVLDKRQEKWEEENFNPEEDSAEDNYWTVPSLP